MKWTPLTCYGIFDSLKRLKPTASDKELYIAGAKQLDIPVKAFYYGVRKGDRQKQKPPQQPKEISVIPAVAPTKTKGETIKDVMVDARQIQFLLQHLEEIAAAPLDAKKDTASDRQKRKEDKRLYKIYQILDYTNPKLKPSDIYKLGSQLTDLSLQEFKNAVKKGLEIVRQSKESPLRALKVYRQYVKLEFISAQLGVQNVSELGALINELPPAEYKKLVQEGENDYKSWCDKVKDAKTIPAHGSARTRVCIEIVRLKQRQSEAQKERKIRKRHPSREAFARPLLEDPTGIDQNPNGLISR